MSGLQEKSVKQQAAEIALLAAQFLAELLYNLLRWTAKTSKRLIAKVGGLAVLAGLLYWGSATIGADLFTRIARYMMTSAYSEMPPVMGRTYSVIAAGIALGVILVLVFWAGTALIFMDKRDGRSLAELFRERFFNTLLCVVFLPLSSLYALLMSAVWGRTLIFRAEPLSVDWWTLMVVLSVFSMLLVAFTEWLYGELYFTPDGASSA